MGERRRRRRRDRRLRSRADPSVMEGVSVCAVVAARHALGALGGVAGLVGEFGAVGKRLNGCVRAWLPGVSLHRVAPAFPPPARPPARPPPAHVVHILPVQKFPRCQSQDTMGLLIQNRHNQMSSKRNNDPVAGTPPYMLQYPPYLIWVGVRPY